MPSPPRTASPVSPVPLPRDLASSEVQKVLRDLGAQVRRGGEPELPPEPRPTGLDPVDRMLGGGFPQGRLSEICGAAGRGRTSLALALLAHTTAAGEWSAVVDPANAFDPPSAEAAGVELERVLWARPRGLDEALRSAEHLLDAHGFALVLFDLAPAAGQPSPRIPAACWPRLRRSAAGTGAALVVLGARRMAGSFADVAVELEDARPRFLPGPSWLAEIDTRLALVRNRTGPDGLSTRVGWQIPGLPELPPLAGELAELAEVDSAAPPEPEAGSEMQTSPERAEPHHSPRRARHAERAA